MDGELRASSIDATYKVEGLGSRRRGDPRHASSSRETNRLHESARSSRVALRRVLSSRYSTDDEKGLASRGDGLGKRRVRRVVREVLLAGEESQKRSPHLRCVIANGAAEHGVSGFEGI